MRWTNAYGSGFLPAADAASSSSAAESSPAAPAFPSRVLALSQRWEESFSNSLAWTLFDESPKPAAAAAPVPAAPFPNWPPGRGSTLSMSLSCDGSELASGHGDHSIRLWNLSTHQAQARHTLLGHTRTPCQLRFHPSLPHLLASADLSGSVRVWDTALGHELARYECSSLPEGMRAGQQKERVAGLSWFPSAERILLGFICKKRCWVWMLHDRTAQRDPSPHLIANLRATPKLASTRAAAPADASPAAAPTRVVAHGSKRDRGASAENDAPSSPAFGDKKRKQEHPIADAGATTNGIEVSAAAAADASSAASLAFSTAAASSSPSPLSWDTLCENIRSSLQGSCPSKPVCILKAACE